MVNPNEETIDTQVEQPEDEGAAEEAIDEAPVDEMPPPFAERFGDTLQGLQAALRREEGARLSVEERLAAEATAMQRAQDETLAREDAQDMHGTSKTDVGAAFDGLIALAREWQTKNL